MIADFREAVADDNLSSCPLGFAVFSGVSWPGLSSEFRAKTRFATVSDWAVPLPSDAIGASFPGFSAGNWSWPARG
jgi:hypothetical protein